MDSLFLNLDDDERDTRIAHVRPAFKTLVEQLKQEVRKEEKLHDPISRDDQATTADERLRNVVARANVA